MRVLSKIGCFLIGTVYDRILRPFPTTVRIETTNRCNSHCVICPHQKMTRPLTTMSEELYRKIIDECSEHKLKTIHLHNFGEPLLDKDLFKRITYAKAKGISHVKIFSNGSLLNASNITALLDSGLDEIKISIDGADRLEYESIRVGLKYDVVIANIKELIAQREKRALKHPKTLVACCTTSNRAKSMDNLKDIVDGYSFGKLHNWGDQNVSPAGACRKPCYRVWSTFTILADGDVCLCCLDFDGKVNLGNLATQTSISGIWNSDLYKKVRRMHKTAAQADIPICMHCSKSFF
ncbi:MAG: radical SAM/SPASM domain-containing protein [Syntrophobacteraceae bacterium]